MPENVKTCRTSSGRDTEACHSRSGSGRRAQWCQDRSNRGFYQCDVKTVLVYLVSQMLMFCPFVKLWEMGAKTQTQCQLNFNLTLKLNPNLLKTLVLRSCEISNEIQPNKIGNSLVPLYLDEAHEPLQDVL